LLARQQGPGFDIYAHVLHERLLDVTPGADAALGGYRGPSDGGADAWCRARLGARVWERVCRDEVVRAAMDLLSDMVRGGVWCTPLVDFMRRCGFALDAP
jgi:hypothetical protein